MLAVNPARGEYQFAKEWAHHLAVLANGSAFSGWARLRARPKHQC
jgi:hypothetical protein